MPTPEQLLGYLKASLGKFNASADREGLLLSADLQFPKLPAASEMAIAHRLAVYLEQILTEFPAVANEEVVIDCEYNRHLNTGKRMYIAKELADIVTKARRTVRVDPDNHDRCMFSVLPDIIIHRRAVDEHNLLVIEMKKESNPEFREYDQLKLRAFTMDGPIGYGYILGATVVVPDKHPPIERFLRCGTLFVAGSEWNPPEDHQP